MARSRRNGCPDGGRVHFSQQAVDRIPETATVTELADALGIKRTTVQQWFKQKTNPLKYTVDVQKKKQITLKIKLFAKAEVIRWLIETYRFKAHSEYAGGSIDLFQALRRWSDADKLAIRDALKAAPVDFDALEERVRNIDKDREASEVLMRLNVVRGWPRMKPKS